MRLLLSHLLSSLSELETESSLNPPLLEESRIEEMGRGKIEIKRIENTTNRQVTYSKRRNGLFKKAKELSVLCDAKVSILMFSNTGKFHEYTSPNTSTKSVYDQYQRTLGIDLWSSHYKRMEENLRKLKEINYKLRTEIRQRTGNDLHDLDFKQLHSLEQKISSPLAAIRSRKYHVMNTQTQTYNKKVNNLKQVHGNLLLSFEEYELGSMVELVNGATNLHAFRLHINPEQGFTSPDLHTLHLA